MAYYHRRVGLNRFERFELSADLKASQLKTSTDKKQRSADDYGSGIAAQFGLIKKISDDKCKKISEVSLQRKKDACQEKKRITISKQNPHDKINCKRLRKLSTDDKIGTSRDESSSSDEDSSPPNRKHSKLKEDREVKNRQDKNINSKLSRKLSIDDNIGTSIDKSSFLNEDFSPPSKHSKSREDQEMYLNKAKRKSLPKEINLHQAISKKNHVRNESSGNTDHHISKSKKCMRNVISSQKIKRSTVNAYTAKRCNNSEVGHSERKSRNKYSDSNSPENPDDEVKQSVKRHRTSSNHLREDNLTGTNNLMGKGGNAYDETIKKKRIVCTGKQFCNDGDRKSNVSTSTPKKDNEPRKEKHKTYTITKVNKVTALDYKGSSTNFIGEINEKVVNDEGTNIPLKEQMKCRRSTVYDDNDDYMKRKNNVCETIEDFIKKESIEDEDVDIPYHSFITDQGKNIQNESNNKIHIYSAGNEIWNFSKICTKIKNCKGEDLTPWFSLVCDGLRPKHSKTDNSNLNYFITLHSRFMVMETMEMNDLEVLPEDESEVGIGSEPIRIFTNLSKDHYKQYLDESCLNSIPELIVTRLYKT